MFFCSKVKVAAGRLCQAAPPGSMVTRPELDNSAYLEQSSDTVINGATCCVTSGKSLSFSEPYFAPHYIKAI